MARIKICKHEGCKDAATTRGYCRLHYLKYWKRIKDEEGKKSANKLNKYVEHIVKSHPDRYMDVIKENLRDESFGDEVEDVFDRMSGGEALFDDPTYDEEIDNLIKELKIEKNY